MGAPLLARKRVLGAKAESVPGTAEVLTSAKATGTITLSGQPGDGDTVTIDDGTHDPVVFEFDTGDGVTPGNVEVTVGGSKEATMAALVVAINAQTDSDFTIVATPNSPADAACNLVNSAWGAAGTAALAKSGANIAVVGMTGGRDYDAAAVALVVFDPRIQPTVEMAHRERAGTFGEHLAVPGTRTGVITFSLELSGSGNAGSPVPASADLFLPAAGFTRDVSGGGAVFSPDITPVEADGALTHTLTMGLWQDGKYQQLHGAQGTVKFIGTAGQIIRLEFTFTGIYTSDVDGQLPEPVFPTVYPIHLRAAGDLSLDAWTPRVATFELMANNDVQLEEDATSATGYIFAAINDQTFTGKIDPEKRLAAEADLRGEWVAGTGRDFTLALGAGGDGKSVTFAAPILQPMNIQDGERKKLLTDELEFMLHPDSGRDELTLTFS